MPTTVLQLVFRNEEGRTVTISVNDPIDSLEPEAVEVVMNDILERDVFYSNGGSLVEKVAARLVSREVTTLI